MDTPSAQLSAKIVERLILEKLLLSEDREKLLTKLSGGQLSQEDWRLAVERAIDKEVKA